jgi:hypothetical protein
LDHLAGTYPRVHLAQNLIPDGEFSTVQAGVMPWWGDDYGPVTFARISSESYVGEGCLKISGRTEINTAAGIFPLFRTAAVGDSYLPVSENRIYSVEVVGRASAGTGNRLQVILHYYTLAGGPLGTYTAGDANPPTALWVAIADVEVGDATANPFPVGTRLLRVEVRDISSNVTAENLIGAVVFYGQSDSSNDHDPVTLKAGHDPALSISGQELDLADVLTPTEHTSIGDGAPHHARAHTVTVVADHPVTGGAALQSTRINAAGTGWEWITPWLGGGGASAYRQVQFVLFVDGVQVLGTQRKNFQITRPEAMTLKEVHLICKTAPTGSDMVFDVNLDGGTIFTTVGNRPKIVVSAYSGTSGTPDITAAVKNSVLTVDCDQKDSNDVGADVTVEIRAQAQAGGSVWFNGAGAPGAGTGNDGDYYLRTSNGDVYQKVGGSWGSPIENLTGPAGASTFDALTDTPANKTGSSLKVARVNVGETALEYRAFVHTDLGGVSSDQHHAAVTVADSTTIDLTLAGQQISGAAISQMSITADASGLKLSGDATSPGNNKVYGTDGAGTKGWKADPAGGGGGMSFFDTPGKMFGVLPAGASYSVIGCGLGAGGTPSLDNDATTSWMKYTCVATSGQSGGHITSVYTYTRRQHNPTFLIHIKTGASVAAMRCWSGFTSAALGNADDPAVSLAAFRYSSGVSANWYCCCKDGATMNAVDSGIACAAATSFWLKIIINDGAGTVDFYIDGVLKQTLNANLPAAATDLGVWAWYFYTTEDVAKTMSFAGWMCSRAS